MSIEALFEEMVPFNSTMVGENFENLDLEIRKNALKSQEVLV